MREGLEKIVPGDDPTVALATPIGRSGVGLVRVSRGGTRELTTGFLRLSKPLTSRHAVVGHFLDEHGQVIDEVLTTFFESPGSYTGEDVLEISAHGNPFILKQIIE